MDKKRMAEAGGGKGYWVLAAVGLTDRRRWFSRSRSFRLSLILFFSSVGKRS